MTDPKEQEQEQESKPPSIVITFADHQSADVRIDMYDVSPFQIWGAARTLEQTATDHWQSLQMQRAMEIAKAQQQEPSITPVRGGIKGVPMDHLKKGGRN